VHSYGNDYNGEDLKINMIWLAAASWFYKENPTAVISHPALDLWVKVVTFINRLSVFVIF
jgi:hypothetical protein